MPNSRAVIIVGLAVLVIALIVVGVAVLTDLREPGDMPLEIRVSGPLKDKIERIRIDVLNPAARSAQTAHRRLRPVAGGDLYPDGWDGARRVFSGKVTDGAVIWRKLRDHHELKIDIQAIVPGVSGDFRVQRRIPPPENQELIDAIRNPRPVPILGGTIAPWRLGGRKHFVLDVSFKPDPDHAREVEVLVQVDHAEHAAERVVVFDIYPVNASGGTSGLLATIGAGQGVEVELPEGCAELVVRHDGAPDLEPTELRKSFPDLVSGRQTWPATFAWRELRKLTVQPRMTNRAQQDNRRDPRFTVSASQQETGDDWIAVSSGHDGEVIDVTVPAEIKRLRVKSDLGRGDIEPYLRDISLDDPHVKEWEIFFTWKPPSLPRLRLTITVRDHDRLPADVQPEFYLQTSEYDWSTWVPLATDQRLRAGGPYVIPLPRGVRRVRLTHSLSGDRLSPKQHKLPVQPAGTTDWPVTFTGIWQDTSGRDIIPVEPVEAERAYGVIARIERWNGSIETLPDVEVVAAGQGSVRTDGQGHGDFSVTRHDETSFDIQCRAPAEMRESLENSTITRSQVHRAIGGPIEVVFRELRPIHLVNQRGRPLPDVKVRSAADSELLGESDPSGQLRVRPGVDRLVAEEGDRRHAFQLGQVPRSSGSYTVELPWTVELTCRFSGERVSSAVEALIVQSEGQEVGRRSGAEIPAAGQSFTLPLRSEAVIDARLREGHDLGEVRVAGGGVLSRGMRGFSIVMDRDRIVELSIHKVDMEPVTCAEWTRRLGDVLEDGVSLPPQHLLWAPDEIFGEAERGVAEEAVNEISAAGQSGLGDMRNCQGDALMELLRYRAMAAAMRYDSYTEEHEDWALQEIEAMLGVIDGSQSRLTTLQSLDLKPVLLLYRGLAHLEREQWQNARRDFMEARTIILGSRTVFGNQVKLEAEAFETYSYYWQWHSVGDRLLLRQARVAWRRWKSEAEYQNLAGMLQLVERWGHHLDQLLGGPGGG